MATTYKEIKRQIADLEKKAADARKSEVAKVIADIRAQISEYELTPEDLFRGIRPAAKPAPSAKTSKRAGTVQKSANPPKYMDPKSGKTWTGHGKAPGWIAAAIKKGKKDDFLIANIEMPRTAKALAPQKVNKAAGAKLGSAKPAVAKPVKAKSVVKVAAGAPGASKLVATKKAKPVPAVKKSSVPKKPVVKTSKAPVALKKAKGAGQQVAPAGADTGPEMASEILSV